MFHNAKSPLQRGEDRRRVSGGKGGGYQTEEVCFLPRRLEEKESFLFSASLHLTRSSAVTTSTTKLLPLLTVGLGNNSL